MRNLFSKFGSVVCAVAAVIVMASCGGRKPDNTYTITCTLPSQISDMECVYLYTVSNDRPVLLDSAKVVNGQFKMSGVAPDTIMQALLMRNGNVRELKDLAPMWSFFVEQGDIVIDTNSFFATGTPTNDGINDWMSQLMTAASPEEIARFLNEHWAEHSSDFVGAYVLEMMSAYLDFATVDALASQIPDDLIQQYAVFRMFKEQLEAVRKMQPGCDFTDGELTTIDGGSVKLSDYVGKGDYVLVDFWASWCGPCRQAMPELQALAPKFKSLKILGVAVNDDVPDTKKAIDDLNIKWSVVFDNKGAVARTYGVNAIPAMILFSPDGKIAARDINVAELESVLTELVK